MIQHPILLISTQQFSLPGTKQRFWHMATLHMGFREFMVFRDRLTQQVYIEEITGGHGPNFIADQQLAEELANFSREKGILKIRPEGWYE
jgi:hypothetical protein